MRNVSLKTIALPEFGAEGELPEIPTSEFEERIARTLAEMKKRNLDVLLVFADREHFANFRYLTGLDPRFEEALLLLDKTGKRKILFGNECMSLATSAPIPYEFELFQEFSLLAQDRSLSRDLQDILVDFGIKKDLKVGCAYYKYFADKNARIIHQQLEIPAYLADLLRKITFSENVQNANDIFMNASTGLRNHCSLNELAQFEWASVRTSESIKNMLRELEPGKKEYELARNYVGDGLPYSCHPMLSTGEKAKYGLSSPSANKVRMGDAFTSAFGIWGALSCRAAMVAERPEQVDRKVAEYYEKFWRNYFQCVVAWYESLAIGATGGEVYEKTEEARDKAVLDFALNTGHTIHLDEWVDSPFHAGSTIPLHSGLALQMDIIPVSKGGFVVANIEDGIILADEKLRNDWVAKYPQSWKRIQQRRDFMINQLGIQIKPEVLPLSNMPAYYPPYLLSKDLVAVVET